VSESFAAPLERAAALFPGNVAVVDGDHRWTYAELRRNVAGLDAALDGLGLDEASVVAVLAANSVEHLVAYLAIPRSLRVLADLNTRLATSELAFILGDAGAKTLMVDEANLQVGMALSESCPDVANLIFMGPGDPPVGMESMSRMMAEAPRDPAMPKRDAPAGLFYTGGTTGRPKGVILTHENLIMNARNMLIEIAFGEEDAYLHVPPMFHLADSGSTLAVTWVGARHVIGPNFDPESWLATVERDRPTHCVLVPTMVNMLVNQAGVGERDLSSLKLVIYAGASLSESILREAMELIPCDWANVYGMTEAAPVVTAMPADSNRRGIRGEEPYARRIHSAGRPVVGVDLRIQREDGTTASADEPGEILVRGPNVMKGYWNRAEETTAALDPDGWYHTGDVGLADRDGFIYIVDRVKDMIISGGENVYSTEVEGAIHGHPAVRECAVIPVPDDHWGERVHAVIVLHPGASLSEREIVEHCRGQIAGYKVPRSIDFRVDPLPTSAAGKVLKGELRAAYRPDREER
jgi:long-chain acyl-CoA synthetase